MKIPHTGKARRGDRPVARVPNGKGSRATCRSPLRIFIRGGEPQDHGNFVVNIHHKDTKDTKTEKPEPNESLARTHGRS